LTFPPRAPTPLAASRPDDRCFTAEESPGSTETRRRITSGGVTPGKAPQKANRRVYRGKGERVRKSAPLARQRGRHGKPRREQDRIGATEGEKPSSRLRAVARVGRMRRLATAVPEEWSSRGTGEPRAAIQNPAYSRLALNFRFARVPLAKAARGSSMRRDDLAGRSARAARDLQHLLRRPAQPRALRRLDDRPLDQNGCLSMKPINSSSLHLGSARPSSCRASPLPQQFGAEIPILRSSSASSPASRFFKYSTTTARRRSGGSSPAYCGTFRRRVVIDCDGHIAFLLLRDQEQPRIGQQNRSIGLRRIGLREPSR